MGVLRDEKASGLPHTLKPFRKIVHEYLGRMNDKANVVTYEHLGKGYIGILFFTDLCKSEIT